MSNILIVHAHPEAESFSSALAKATQESLESEGHTVLLKDLYAMNFDPVSGRKNFQKAVDSEYFKQQAEEVHASENDGFDPALEKEIKDLEWADAVIFSFPLWWFTMPAILKGWVDKVFAYGRVYGGPKLYEGGLGQALKPAKILMTTGGPENMYDGYGLNPPMEQILTPIEHGIFWFNGFTPLPPTIAWGPARWTHEARVDFLNELKKEAKSLFTDKPRVLPRRDQFEGVANDRFTRTRVIVRQKKAPDAAYESLLSEEMNYLQELKRLGVLLDFQLTAQSSESWMAFLDLRTETLEDVEQVLGQLPLDEYFEYETLVLGRPR